MQSSSLALAVSLTRMLGRFGIQIDNNRVCWHKRYKYVNHCELDRWWCTRTIINTNVRLQVLLQHWQICYYWMCYRNRIEKWWPHTHLTHWWK